MDISTVKVVKIKKFFGNFVAIVPFPETIFVVEEYAVVPEVMAHELVHVEQWRRYGFRYPLMYVQKWFQNGMRWTTNPMEVEAVERTPEFLDDAKRLIKEQVLEH